MNSNNEPIKKSRKERRRERDRNTIMNTAENLFLEQGYDNTTMKQIAEKAEFSKGTLYNHFESKFDLYLAIGTIAYEHMINISTNYIEKEKPGISQLMAFGYAYYDFTKQYPAYATIFHDISLKNPNLMEKDSNSLTKAEKKYIEESLKYRKLFVGAISKAIKLKKIRSDINPLMIGISLSMLSTGLINELMHNKIFFKKQKFSGDDVIDFVFNSIAEGLKPKDNNKEV
jgi:AcrR family transcriptional regulator